MAKILIFQERPGQLHAFKNSLVQYHELFFVRDESEAIAILQENAIDLIIARVHLEQGSVFEFVRRIKHDGSYAHIPLLCFCGRRTQLARQLDASMKKASETFGADGYMCIDQFCSEHNCDFDALRKAIESFLMECSET